jgi:hypothetical protein
MRMLLNMIFKQKFQNDSYLGPRLHTLIGRERKSTNCAIERNAALRTAVRKKQT